MDSFPPRYWSPLGKLSVYARGGFSPDFAEPAVRNAWPEPVSLEGLRDVPALVLLAEPGMGKTTDLLREYEAVESSSAAGSQETALWVPLGGTRQEDVLRSRIQGESVWNDWIAGAHVLYLFLDALDEARLRVDTVAAVLREVLGGAPIERLRVRLTCRAADRLPEFEQFLEDLFPGLQRRELLPLTRADLRRMAAERGLDPTQVEKSVDRAELANLVACPATLIAMLDGAARNGGQLPRTRAEAQKQGMLALLSEPDQARRQVGPPHRASLTPAERLGVAARIAAALTLSGTSSVRIDGAIPGPDEVSPSSLVGGTEPVPDAPVEHGVTVDESAILEVLKTGAFGPESEGAVALVRQTYADFLTAWWLAQDRRVPSQVRDLLVSRSLGPPRVVSVLREVAAWTAELDEPFSRWLLEHDPATALRAAPERLDAVARSRSVDALMQQVGRLAVDRFDRRIRATYEHLDHPGLEHQLRAIIFSADAERLCREAACEIAAACGCRGVGEELVELAHDPETWITVRTAAVDALEVLGTVEQLERLTDLAVDPPNDDDDELRGAALAATWPRALAPAALLTSLRPPKRRNLYGAYRGFLDDHDVASEIPEDHLAAGLRWAISLPVDNFERSDRSLAKVQQRLLARALKRVESDPAVGEYAMQLALRLSGPYGPAIEPKHVPDWPHEDEFRPIVPHLARRAARAPEVIDRTLLTQWPLVRVTDLVWVVDQLSRAHGRARRGWALILEGLARMPWCPDEPLLEAREMSPLVRELTAWRYEPVVLGSPEAVAMRERHGHTARIGSRADLVEARTDEEAAALEGVDGLLARAEAGEHRAFWEVTHLLEIGTDRGPVQVSEPDVRKLPGWGRIDKEQRARYLVAARVYVHDALIDDARFVGKASLYFYPAAAGYRALRLLHAVGDTLETEVWRRWTGAIAEWFVTNVDGADTFHGEAVQQALNADPDHFAAVLAKCLDGRLSEPTVRLGLVEHLGTAWAPQIEDAVLRRARRSRLAPERRARLVEILLERGSVAGLGLARRLVSRDAVRAEGPRRDTAERIAVVLAKLLPEAWKANVWPGMVEDATFGRSVALSLAGDRSSGLTTRLAPGDLGAVWMWLYHQFPPREDPSLDDEDGDYTARHQLSDWRNGMIETLSTRGSAEAVEQLDRIVEVAPEQQWIRQAAMRARENQALQEWAPPCPGHVIRIGNDARLRWVTTSADLLEVVLTAFEPIQARLQGSPPAAAFLWDSRARKPKMENQVSDWLVLELRSELQNRSIVVDREVQVTPHPVGRMGEAVDIAVTAANEPGEPLRVLLEVKGCWNREVETAMSAQLVDRYLKGSGAAGIYVVAWFQGLGWNQPRCFGTGPDVLREMMEAQTSELGGGGVNVAAVVLDCSV